MQKEDDFFKSPVEAPVHRRVLLEDKDISPKTQDAFDELCKKYDDIISKNSGDIGKTMLVEMKINTGNHPSPPHSIKTLHPTPETRMGPKRNRNTRKSRNNRKKHLTMGITSSDSSKEKHTRRTSQKENVPRLPENQQITTGGHQSRRWKRMHFTCTTSKNRRTLHQTQRLQSLLKSRSQIRILPHWTNRFSKTKISIRLIISRQISIQQSSIRTGTSTSILQETDK